MSRISLTEQQLLRIIKKSLHEIDNPFERIAFADQRKNIAPGTEPNTPIEDKALRELYFFVDTNDDLSPESVAAIKDSLARGLHNDIIYYSRAPVQYRGMYLTTQEIEQYFDIDPEDLPANGKRIFKFPFEFKPRKKSGLSSWSSDYKVAEEISLEFAGWRDQWAVILVAPSALNPNNFLDLTSIYEVLDTIYDNQKESIALGSVKVTEVHIFMPEDY